MLDVNHSAYAEKWTRMRSQSRSHDTPDGPDLFLGNGYGYLAGSQDADDTGSRQDWHNAIVWVKMAKEIARKERQRHFLDSVGPAPARTVHWQEFFKTLTA